jgi:hypothetical protein
MVVDGNIHSMPRKMSDGGFKLVLVVVRVNPQLLEVCFCKAS